MLIAAMAAVHSLTLVMRSVKDFEGCGIGLINPFKISYAEETVIDITKKMHKNKLTFLEICKV